MEPLDNILNSLGDKELRFWISGVYCNNCVNKIFRALKTINGVKEVEIIPDFKELKALAIVKYKGDMDKKEIEEVLYEISGESPYHEYKPIWE
ncbi:MAG: heavy metal-associated domain-containing protein [Saccharolobus sp.]